MTEAHRTIEQRCSKQVSDRTGYHWYRCDKPVKFKVTFKDGTVRHLCGIHALQVSKRPMFDHREAVS